MRTLRIETAAVTALIGRIDDTFATAVDLLQETTGKVVVTGMGKSGLIGQKIAATMASTGTPAIFLHPADGLHGDLGIITRDDLVIAISNSGETAELLSILPSLKRLAVPIIALTGRAGSTLGRAAEVVLDISVAEEACPLGLAPTASTTATLAMGDALAVALLDRKGFREEDFALSHPGGALGRRLLMRVKDGMHSGAEIPAVGPDTPMREAIVEITRKRLGITTVVDAAGNLLGVISDGDLRRRLEEGTDFMNQPARAVMTANPKSISQDALAAEAVVLMERHAITCLVVMDGGRLAGLVHLHDLLKMGLG
ncbi:MAG: KpsF/GutQ family sugar-phosphate isomerase [Nitrospirae bacterium]|nr:KpsF/GutQ family sugar-phosphate isomerase [Nitrospirota bacterium]